MASPARPPYQPGPMLRNCHHAMVSCMAFSSRGDRLISGGIDGILCVWDVANGEAIYKLSIGREIICLLWHPSQHTKVFCGCADGALILDVATSIACEILTGSKDPVYALDYDAATRLLAIAVGNEVHVAKEAGEKLIFATFILFPRPSELISAASSNAARVRPRSVHFLDGGRRLAVSYLHHGIICWSIPARKEVWKITPSTSHRRIGFCALSPDGRRLLFSNLEDGMSLHAIGNSVASKVFKQEVSESDNIPLPVAFIRGGREVVCSSLCSDVNIWDVDSTIPFQALGHANTPVNTISAYDGYTYSLLACATAGRGKPVIRIWMAPRPRWFSTFFVHSNLIFLERAISTDRSAVFYGMICVMAILFVSALAFTWTWHTSYFSSVGPDMSHALRFIRSQFVDMFGSR